MSSSPENKDELQPLRRSTRKSVAAKLEEQVLTPRKRKSTATPLKNAPEKNESVGTPRKTRATGTPRKSLVENVSTPKKSVVNLSKEQTPKKELRENDNTGDISPVLRRTPRKSLRTKEDSKKPSEIQKENNSHVNDEEATLNKRGRRKSTAAVIKKKNGKTLEISNEESSHEEISPPIAELSSQKEDSELGIPVSISVKRKSRKSVHFKAEVDECHIESDDSPPFHSTSMANEKIHLTSVEENTLKSSLAVAPKFASQNFKEHIKEANPAETPLERSSFEQMSDGLEKAVCVAETIETNLGIESSLDNALLSPKKFLNSDDDEPENVILSEAITMCDQSSKNDINAAPHSPIEIKSNKNEEICNVANEMSNVTPINEDELQFKSPRRKLSYEKNTDLDCTLGCSEETILAPKEDNILFDKSLKTHNELIDKHELNDEKDISNNLVRNVNSAEEKEPTLDSEKRVLKREDKNNFEELENTNTLDAENLNKFSGEEHESLGIKQKDNDSSSCETSPLKLELSFNEATTKLNIDENNKLSNALDESKQMIIIDKPISSNAPDNNVNPILIQSGNDKKLELINENNLLDDNTSPFEIEQKMDGSVAAESKEEAKLTIQNDSIMGNDSVCLSEKTNSNIEEHERNYYNNLIENSIDGESNLSVLEKSIEAQKTGVNKNEIDDQCNIIKENDSSSGLIEITHISKLKKDKADQAEENKDDSSHENELVSNGLRNSMDTIGISEGNHEQNQSKILKSSSIDNCQSETFEIDENRGFIEDSSNNQKVINPDKDSPLYHKLEMSKKSKISVQSQSINKQELDHLDETLHEEKCHLEIQSQSSIIHFNTTVNNLECRPSLISSSDECNEIDESCIKNEIDPDQGTLNSCALSQDIFNDENKDTNQINTDNVTQSQDLCNNENREEKQIDNDNGTLNSSVLSQDLYNEENREEKQIDTDNGTLNSTVLSQDICSDENKEEKQIDTDNVTLNSTVLSQDLCNDENKEEKQIDTDNGTLNSTILSQDVCSDENREENLVCTDNDALNSSVLPQDENKEGKQIVTDNGTLNSTVPYQDLCNDENKEEKQIDTDNGTLNCTVLSQDLCNDENKEEKQIDTDNGTLNSTVLSQDVGSDENREENPVCTDNVTLNSTVLSQDLCNDENKEEKQNCIENESDTNKSSVKPNIECTDNNEFNESTDSIHNQINSRDKLLLGNFNHNISKKEKKNMPCPRDQCAISQELQEENNEQDIISTENNSHIGDDETSNLNDKKVYDEEKKDIDYQGDLISNATIEDKSLSKIEKQVQELAANDNVNLEHNLSEKEKDEGACHIENNSDLSSLGSNNFKLVDKKKESQLEENILNDGRHSDDDRLEFLVASESKCTNSEESSVSEVHSGNIQRLVSESEHSSYVTSQKEEEGISQNSSTSRNEKHSEDCDTKSGSNGSITQGFEPFEKNPDLGNSLVEIPKLFDNSKEEQCSSNDNAAFVDEKVIEHEDVAPKTSLDSVTNEKQDIETGQKRLAGLHDQKTIKKVESGTKNKLISKKQQNPKDTQILMEGKPNKPVNEKSKKVKPDIEKKFLGKRTVEITNVVIRKKNKLILDNETLNKALDESDKENNSGISAQDVLQTEEVGKDKSPTANKGNSESDISPKSVAGFFDFEVKENKKQCHINYVQSLFNTTVDINKENEDDSNWAPPPKKANNEKTKVTVTKKKVTLNKGQDDLKHKVNLPLETGTFNEAISNAVPTKQGLFSVSSNLIVGKSLLTNTNEEIHKSLETKQKSSLEELRGFSVSNLNEARTLKHQCKNIPSGFIVTEHSNDINKTKSDTTSESLISKENTNAEGCRSNQTSSKLMNPSTIEANETCYVSAVLPHRLTKKEIQEAFKKVGISDIVSIKYTNPTVAVLEFTNKKSFKRALKSYGQIKHRNEPIYVLAGKDCH